MNEEYKRACERLLTDRGFTVQPESMGTTFSAPLPYIEDEKERYTVWLAESLLSGFRAHDRGDRLIALRCYVQVCETAGRLKYTPAGLGDAMITLRNVVEGYVR